MTSLITLLISLLGYGTPADFSNMTEVQLENEIVLAQEAQASDEDGGFGDWDDTSIDGGE